MPLADKGVLRLCGRTMQAEADIQAATAELEQAKIVRQQHEEYEVRGTLCTPTTQTFPAVFTKIRDRRVTLVCPMGDPSADRCGLQLRVVVLLCVWM